jgi:hypothetical protein
VKAPANLRLAGALFEENVRSKKRGEKGRVSNKLWRFCLMVS